MTCVSHVKPDEATSKPIEQLYHVLLCGTYQEILAFFQPFPRLSAWLSFLTYKQGAPSMRLVKTTVMLRLDQLQSPAQFLRTANPIHNGRSDLLPQLMDTLHKTHLEYMVHRSGFM